MYETATDEEIEEYKKWTAEQGWPDEVGMVLIQPMTARVRGKG